MEEARLANEARERELAEGAAAREKRAALDAMNRRAYDACVPVWKELKARAVAGVVAGADGGGGGGGGGGGVGGGTAEVISGGADAEGGGNLGDVKEGGGNLGDVKEGGGNLGDVKKLTKRILHKAELRVALLTPDEVRKMAPGSWVAMGTSGLEPLEIRTIAYALKLAGVSGAAALRFETIILEKVAALPADDALMTP